MQVNSVSQNNVQTFGNRKQDKMERMIAFANLNDKQLQQIALKKADEKYSAKDYNRKQNLLYYSIPIVSALANIQNPVLVNIPKNITPKNISRIEKIVADRVRSVKLKNFGKSALLGTAAFAVFDMALRAKRKIDKKSETLSNFNKEHPFLATVGNLAIATSAVLLGRAGLAKVVQKLPTKLDRNTLKLLVKGKNFLNNNKVINKVVEAAQKSPELVKTFAKGALNFAPWLLVLGSFTNSINYSGNKTREIYKNYDQLKTAQAEVRAVLDDMDADA
ncbi:MAG: hypothetical protein ACI37Q_04765 [Candidatus Gastranaerophilaceae bacterium]